MSKEKAFIKTSITYFLGSALTSLMSFFLLPIYTNKIPTADYGYYDLMVSYITLFSTVIFFNIWTAVLRFMSDGKEINDKYKSVYSAVPLFITSTLITIITGLLIYRFVQIEYSLYIIVYTIILSLSYYYSYVIRGFRKNLIFIISGLTAAVVNLITNIILLLVFNWDYSSLYISHILGYFVQIIILEFNAKLIKNFSFQKIDFKQMKAIFRFALPLCINSAAYWLMTSFNKIVVVKYLGTDINGLYATAMKFGVILTFISNCIQMAWQEMAFDVGAEGKNYSIYSQASNFYLKILILATACLIPFIYIFFPFIIDPQYAASKGMVPIYILATMANIYSTFLGSIFAGLKKTSIVFFSTIAGSLVSVAIIFSTIKILGIEAANISLLIGFLISIVIRILLLKKSINFRFDIKLLLLLPLVAISVIIYKLLPQIYVIIYLIMIIISSVFFLKNEINKIIIKKVSKHGK